MFQLAISFLVKVLQQSKFVLINLALVMSLITTAHAQPEVIPNKPINAQTAKALDKADATSNLGQLKTVNKSLATQNATLEQENNALQTQVNVLAAERSNQLFMTGAFVAIGGIFLGFIAAWLLLGRRGSDW